MRDNQSPLTGKALLQKVKDNTELSKRELAKQCGYYTESKEGEIRASMTSFYNALLEAQGISLEPEKAKTGRGRDASYVVTVHSNGQIVIGSAYTREMGLEPGDEFEIKLGYKHIHLIQLDEENAKAA